MENVQMIEMDKQILEGKGSYCLRSKKESAGYINKNKWLNDRFEEGLKYVQLLENNRHIGFVEYAEAEFSSRVVHADNYLVIHCLWVSATGKGFGSKLINKCLDDARKLNKDGVVVITNPDTSWTPSKDIFLKNNFKIVATTNLNFELLVYQFNENASTPHFPTNWKGRLEKFNDLTILRSFQCPYVDIATQNVQEAANHLGIKVDIIDFKDREEMMNLSPTPYGVYSVVYRGELVAFHRLTVHSAVKRLREITRG